jgi:hypothetical protein
MLMFAMPTALLILAVTAPGAPAGHTPSAEEQKAFADGVRSFETGDARGAERAWKLGYAVGHDPAFLVRVGEAEEQAGATKDAIESYEHYLREAPDASDRGDIESRIRRLAPPGSTSKPGGADTPEEFGASPGSSLPVRATAPASGSTGPAVRSVPAVAVSRGLQAQDDPNEDLRPIIDESEAPRSRLNTTAWVGAGVTTLLLGVAAFYGASAAEKSGDANRLLIYSDPNTGVPTEYKANAQQFESDVRAGQHDDRVAKGLLIAAGVTALASTVLFIVDSASPKKDAGWHARSGSDGRRSTTTPRRRRSGLGLGLSWTF